MHSQDLTWRVGAHQSSFWGAGVLERKEKLLDVFLFKQSDINVDHSEFIMRIERTANSDKYPLVPLLQADYLQGQEQNLRQDIPLLSIILYPVKVEKYLSKYQPKKIKNFFFT